MIFVSLGSLRCRFCPYLLQTKAILGKIGEERKTRTEVGSIIIIEEGFITHATDEN